MLRGHVRSGGMHLMASEEQLAWKAIGYRKISNTGAESKKLKTASKRKEGGRNEETEKKERRKRRKVREGLRRK